MSWGDVVALLILAPLGLGCVLLTLIGIPGGWILLGLAVATELFRPGFGWGAVVAIAALAAAGELVETAAGAAGSRAGGGTRRGMVGAILGGLAGGIVFTPLLPIPVVGTLVGAALGTFVGAAAGELTAERPPGAGRTLRAAAGATLGRIAGTMGKTLLACAAWVVLVVRAAAGS